MKILSSILFLLFILVNFALAGEKEGIKYHDKYISELDPATLCLPADKYELLNAGQFMDEEGNYVVAYLLAITGTDIKVVIVQRMDNGEVWLAVYEVNGKVYAADKKNNIYLEWDSDKRCFKQKSM